MGCGKPPLETQQDQQKNSTLAVAADGSVTVQGMTKCGNPVPQATGPLPPQPPFPPPPPASPSPPPAPAQAERGEDPNKLGRAASPVTLTTYGWVYTWP